MVGEEDEGMEQHGRVQEEATPQHSENELSALVGRSQQESLLHDAIRDLVGVVGRVPAQRMTHGARCRSNRRAAAMCALLVVLSGVFLSGWPDFGRLSGFRVADTLPPLRTDRSSGG